VQLLRAGDYWQAFLWSRPPPSTPSALAACLIGLLLVAPRRGDAAARRLAHLPAGRRGDLRGRARRGDLFPAAALVAAIGMVAKRWRPGPGRGDRRGHPAHLTSSARL
jgi:hypothetical protein